MDTVSVTGSDNPDGSDEKYNWTFEDGTDEADSGSVFQGNARPTSPSASVPERKSTVLFRPCTEPELKLLNTARQLVRLVGGTIGYSKSSLGKVGNAEGFQGLVPATVPYWAGAGNALEEVTWLLDCGLVDTKLCAPLYDIVGGMARKDMNLSEMTGEHDNYRLLVQAVAREIQHNARLNANKWERKELLALNERVYNKALQQLLECNWFNV